MTPRADASQAALPSREEALARLFAALPPSSPLPVERVAIRDAAGRVLAEDAVSPADVPPFTRSSMDGHAVRAEDTSGASPERPVRLRVVAELAMGRAAAVPLGSGEAAAVATGGMLPEGADAVVPIEESEPADGGILVRAAARAGQHVTPRGADVRAGSVLVPAGRRLGPADLAALAAAGIGDVHVRVPPRVRIIPTGDELVPADQAPAPGQIREFNSVGLAALAARDGARPSVAGIVPDDPDAQARALREALGESDAILVVGGSSVGGRDFTSRVLERFPGPGVLVHGVAIKPGRPTILAVLERPEGRRVPVFGLPGHPVSCFVVYEAFARPTIRRLFGQPDAPRGSVRARLAAPFAAASLEFFARVALAPVDGDPPWEARPIPGDSAILTTLVRAGGILRVPPGARFEPGDVRDVELLD